MSKYVAYLRVSTLKQGKSGLGLDAQRKMCSDFVEREHGTIEREFVDVESGTHRDRRGLWDAIDYCKKNGCSLVIAKLDRLARDIEFTFRIMNTGIDIHFTDMPVVNTMILGVFASVAQYERELTSDRTKKALAQKKAQGAKLGASNEKWKESYKSKSYDEKHKSGKLRGVTRNARFLASAETKAFLKILARVFELDGDPKDWDWSLVNTRSTNRDRIRHMMLDLREMTGTFQKWNLECSTTEDDVAFQRRLSSQIYNVKRAVNFNIND